MEMSRKVRVVIVDDQEVFRIGVKTALERNGRIETVAEGVTEEDALRLVAEHNPDVLLLGLNTVTHQPADAKALSVYDIIRRLLPTDILILSRHAPKALVRSVLQAGASGFITRDEVMGSSGVLAGAILEIAQRKKLRAAQAVYDKLNPYGMEIEDIPQLTKRRIAMMQAIADNPHLSLTQVANMLGIAESTLRNNLSAVSRALNTPNINGAMIECVRLGMVKICR